MKQFIPKQCLVGLVSALAFGWIYAADARLGGKAESPKAALNRSVSTLLGQGQSALLAEDYKAARDTYADVLVLDPRNTMALEGATVAYAQLGDVVHAKNDLEKLLGQTDKLSRSAAINGAAVLVRGKNPMRAVKILMQYLNAQPQVDEDALNAVAVALSQADEQSRKVGLFNTGVKYYLSANEKLEATRPGMKRWGTTWLNADEAQRKNDDWNAALKAADNILRDINTLRNQLSQAQNDLAARKNAARFQSGFAATAYVNQAQSRVESIQREIDNRQQDYDRALDGHERPPIPKTVTMVPVAGAGMQVASAGPGESAASAPPSATDPEPTMPRRAPRTPSTPSDPPTVTTPPPDAPDAPAETGKLKVTSYAAAFAVGPDLLVTAAATVRDATEIQVQVPDGTPFHATVERSSGENGIALLRLSGAKVSYLELAGQYTGGPLTCVSFPTVNIFQPEPAIIPGSGVAPKTSWSVRLSHAPRLPGGPLVVDGKVVGVELAARDSDPTAVPAATLDELKTLLGGDAPAGGGGVTNPATVTLQVSAVREK